MIEEEYWKPLKGYETWYEISSFGRVKSLRRNKLISTKSLSSGYPCFSVCYDGLQITKRVHQVMAETFLNFITNRLMVVNHKDGNKTNNKLSNLEIVSQKYNNEHAIRYNLKKRKAVPVLQFTLDNKFVQEFSSQKEAEEKTGICRKQINACTKGKQKSAKNYIWKYKN